MSLTFRKNIKKIDKSQWEDHLKTEKERLSTTRSQESDGEIKMRRIADASRHVDMREEETSDEHQSRIAIQKHRQEQLRKKETPQEKKARQNSENESKVFKRARPLRQVHLKSHIIQTKIGIQSLMQIWFVSKRKET